MKEKYGPNTGGLYRDDGLCCFRNTSGPASDKIRKDLIQIFTEKFGLKITIKANLKIVDFLDVTFNLTTGTYKPCSKPNSQTIYININSNHPTAPHPTPPHVIKHILDMISEGITRSLSNKNVFDQAAPHYNNALAASSYTKRIHYNSAQPGKQSKPRSCNVIWFNPPFSLNIETNVAGIFLTLIDKNFPKSRRLHKIFNRNNVKVSYSCLPNVSTIITSHNKTTLSNQIHPNEPKCNCRKKDTYPLNGQTRHLFMQR